MLQPEEVAQDAAIFRPDGFIHFPRTDGDDSYGPPNTALPAANEAEVNYYHVFKREEKRHDTWRATLGEQLAQHFKLPQLSPSKAKWKLYDFPEGYQFTEQRKGPRHNPRTDPYLFGSQAHRFRSTKEACEHLIWLLLDPTMDRANCHCKYCDKTPRPATTPSGKRKADLMNSSTAAVAGRRGRKAKDGIDLPNKTSITVRAVEMRRLMPGVGIASVPQRDQEVMHEYERGEQERFRLGEVVWCELDEPIVDPVDPERKILSWPAVVQDPSIDFTLALTNGDDGDKNPSLRAVSAPSQPEESLPVLGGSVGQKISYQINFLGTMEKAKVPASSLTPYLAGFIPSRLTECDMGTPADHPWVYEPDTWPTINLARQPHLPTPAFVTALVPFGYAITTAAVLRSLYSLSDAFSAAPTAEGMLRDMEASDAGGDSQGVPQGPRFYQGLYFGTERIWVGDVVRLKLSANDVQKLQRELNSALVADKLPGAPDPKAIVLDEDGSYVLQLSQIYEDPRAPKVQRVAGEMYEILSTTKLKQLQDAMAASKEEVLANEALDEAMRQEEAKLLEARMPRPSILSGRPGFPPMPPLPPGFVMVSLSERLQSRIPRETTLSIGHVAGRLYPSLGMHSDGPRVKEQMELRPRDRKEAADEDTQNELRARLSLAGLLSGCVKAMRGSVQTYNRTLSLKGALTLARENVQKSLSGEPDDSDDEANASRTSSPAKTPAKKARKSIEAAAAAVATVAPAGVGAVNDAGTEATTQAASSQATLAAQPVESMGAASQAESDEPPLPPDWEARQSRNLGSTYYVHKPTRKTQWDRPTA
jgi:hypothetical protein